MYRQLNATRWECRRLTGNTPLVVSLALPLPMKIQAPKERLRSHFTSRTTASQPQDLKADCPHPTTLAPFPLIVNKRQLSGGVKRPLNGGFVGVSSHTAKYDRSRQRQMLAATAQSHTSARLSFLH